MTTTTTNNQAQTQEQAQHPAIEKLMKRPFEIEVDGKVLVQRYDFEKSEYLGKLIASAIMHIVDDESYDDVDANTLFPFTKKQLARFIKVMDGVGIEGNQAYDNLRAEIKELADKYADDYAAYQACVNPEYMRVLEGFNTVTGNETTSETWLKTWDKIRDFVLNAYTDTGIRLPADLGSGLYASAYFITYLAYHLDLLKIDNELIEADIKYILESDIANERGMVFNRAVLLVEQN